MCTLGNTKSNAKAAVKASDDDERRKAFYSDDVEEKSSNSPAVHSHHEDSDDETSDPVVVSPTGSPVPSTTPLVESSGEEIFQDSRTEVSSSSMAPSPSFVAIGLQRKASPLALKSWTCLALTLDGRDKITKVFQYAARLLTWWFAGKGSTNLSMRFASLYKSLSNSRKAFRLGRSLIEIEKLQNVGLGPLVRWHLRSMMGLEGVGHDLNTISTNNTAERDKGRPTRTYAKKASSNIARGPLTLQDENDLVAEPKSPSLLRSLSTKAYQAVVYRPVRSTVTLLVGDRGYPRKTSASELWNVVGSAFKMVGLLGFWTGDNINYLFSTGFLDDHTLPTEEERLSKRNKWQTLSGEFANKAYFAGSISGLLVNAYSYIRYRREKLTPAEEYYKAACEEEDCDKERAFDHLKTVKAQQFSLFMALLKSCCDVVVFSNNPGIDLHQKWRGKKNHEGLHCMLGLVSAGTVIYNNFPDAS